MLARKRRLVALALLNLVAVADRCVCVCVCVYVCVRGTEREDAQTTDVALAFLYRDAVADRFVVCAYVCM